MPVRETILTQIRGIVMTAEVAGISPAEEAVLRSVLHSVEEADIAPLLDEFFDVDLVVQSIYEAFVAHGSAWTAHTRS